MKKVAAFVLLAALFGAVLTGIDGVGAPAVHAQVSSAAEANTGPFNVVIVVLDCSRSFRIPSRAPGLKGKVFAVEALQLVQQFFRDSAKQKRRRNDRQDIYYLIAADAASQLVWSGTHEQLGALTPEALMRMLAVREQFAQCTDLEMALNEVVAILQRHPDASQTYVLTFSDLLHEPPQKSWHTCAPPSGAPPKGIDWSAFSKARLGFYFVSKDFRYRPDLKWKTELERRGLQADFYDAVQVLTAGVTLSPPAPAVYKATKEEVAIARARVEGVSHTFINALTWLAAIFIMSIAALFGWVFWARRRTADARRQS